MNINRAITDANKRVSAQINANAEAALARIAESFAFARRSEGQRWRFVRESVMDGIDAKVGAWRFRGGTWVFDQPTTEGKTL